MHNFVSIIDGDVVLSAVLILAAFPRPAYLNTYLLAHSVALIL